MQMFGRSSGTPDSVLRILYDGSPLVFAPGASAALHVLELLEVLPDSIESWLALPGETAYLPVCDRLQVVIEPARGELQWEQVTLPALIRRIRPDLVHLTTLRVPFLSPAPCIISPAGLLNSPMNANFRSRLGESLGRGGFSRARAVLWPQDLPDPEWNRPGMGVPLVRLPPRVHSAFYRPQEPPAGLPDSFVFCPGPLSEENLAQLAGVWRWAGAAIGEMYALLIEGLSHNQVEWLLSSFDQSAVPSPVHTITLPDPAARAAVFQRASEVLCLGPVLPWADAFLQALACGRPLAAVETAQSGSRVGPAGYLSPPGDARTLAAAVITPLVEEAFQEQLIAAAHQRAAAWNSDQFSMELEEAYWRAYRRATAT